MTTMHGRPRLIALLLLFMGMVFSASACGDDDPVNVDGTDEPTVSESELAFARFDPAFFDDVPRTASFWAVRGEDRELILESVAEGEDSGEKFLEFEVDAESLLRRPDGTLFAEGDSVEITVQLDPSGRFLFEFQPSGLVFDPDEPAELRIRYVLAPSDLNGDGVVDEEDQEFEEGLSIWKREDPGGPWLQLSSLEVEARELEADVESFTGFALAN